MTKTLFSLLMLLCSIQVLAQTPQYSNGTSGTSANSFPFNAGSTGSNRVQWIMLNSYFPTAPSGLITDVYFRTNLASTTATPTGVQISMVQSNLTQLTSGNWIAPITTVYTSASVTVSISAAGWMRFTLQTPFFYDNTKNFVIEAIAMNTSVSMMQTSTAAGARMYGNYAATTGTANTGLVDFGFDLLPKLGYNNAALYAQATPVAPFCPGNQLISVQVKNAGNNRINSVKVFWEMDGIPQPTANYNNLIDTIAGSLPNIVTVPLGTANFAGSPHSFKFWTALPNGIVDTVTKDDTLYKTQGPSPTAVITPVGTTIFCTAGVINAILNAPTGIGNNYQWKLNGSPIPGALGSSYTATVAGDYSVTIDSNSCSNTSATIRVDNLAMPMPLVTPAGYPVLCDGDSISMVGNAGVTGASYQWKFQGNDIPGATTSSYTAYAPGNYALVTSKLICNATSQGINIIPKPKPVVTIKDSSATGMHILSVDASHQTYQWYVSTSSAPTPVPIPGANQFVYIATQNGDYTVVANNGGCDGFSDTIHVTDLFTSINHIEGSEKIRIYPNPVNSQLQIEAPVGSKMMLCSTDGKILMQQAVGKNAIDLKSIPAGLYMIRIADKNGVVMKTDKLIKNNE